MSDHESGQDELDHDPWDDREAFLASQEAEQEVEEETLVDEDEGEDPLT